MSFWPVGIFIIMSSCNEMTCNLTEYQSRCHRFLIFQRISKQLTAPLKRPLLVIILVSVLVLNKADMFALGKTQVQKYRVW